MAAVSIVSTLMTITLRTTSARVMEVSYYPPFAEMQSIFCTYYG